MNFGYLKMICYTKDSWSHVYLNFKNNKVLNVLVWAYYDFRNNTHWICMYGSKVNSIDFWLNVVP